MKLIVQVKPGRKRESLIWDGKILTLKLNAQAKDGKANVRLKEVMSEFFDISKSSIVIKSGFTASIKRLNINISETVLASKLKKITVKTQERLL